MCSKIFWTHFYFFCKVRLKAYFFARSCSDYNYPCVSLSCYLVNKPFWFSYEKDAATVFFWTHFVLFRSLRSGLFTSALPLLSTWVTCLFLMCFSMVSPLSGSIVTYRQTTAVISAWFVDRYFDQLVLWLTLLKP